MKHYKPILLTRRLFGFLEAKETRVRTTSGSFDFRFWPSKNTIKNNQKENQKVITSQKLIMVDRQCFV